MVFEVQVLMSSFGQLRTSLDLCRFMCHIDHLSSLNLMQHFRIKRFSINSTLIWSCWHDFHNSLMQTFIPSYASNVTMLPFLSSNILRLNVPNREIIALYYLVLGTYLSVSLSSLGASRSSIEGSIPFCFFSTVVLFMQS